LLSLEGHAKAASLELKVANPAKWKAKLLASGVGEIAIPNPDRPFFRATGGQVFRLAHLDAASGLL
jgi:hypothetical protein